MTNALVGEVYLKVIEEVINSSTTDFEESGVSQATLQELRQEWQAKLSQRGVAQMPWDPKPQPTPTPQPSLPAATPNGLPSATYSTYDTPPPSASTAPNGASSAAPRIKSETGAEPQYNGLPNGYAHDNGPTQGGLARATHLVQQQYGPNASASLSAMQRGLALPGGQQQPQTKPQGLHLPGQSTSPPPQQYTPQQQAAMMRQQQQQQFQQQQAQARVKVENDSPQLAQGAFAQQTVQPNYSQTDGADDDALGQWQAMLAERRAIGAEQRQQADRMMRDHITQQSADLTSGLMLPLDEITSTSKQPRSNKSHLANKRKRAAFAQSTDPSSSSFDTVMSQLDGNYDEDEDEKPDVKDEDDENAINSDLDDSDDDGQGNMGEDDDDFPDQILCTYDKVQRVKNKWKCVLKDGVMSQGGKEWVFHKGNGEFEW